MLVELARRDGTLTPRYGRGIRRFLGALPDELMHRHAGRKNGYGHGGHLHYGPASGPEILARRAGQALFTRARLPGGQKHV
jgi:hypothetical protein